MTEDTRLIGSGKYLRLLARGRWEYVERVSISGVVVIVAITPDDKVVFIEQFRPALGANEIELPAGLAGDVAGQEEEELAAAARRELLEESGYDAQHFRVLGSAPTSAGLTNEVLTYLLATDLTRVNGGGGDEHENITVHEVPIREIDRWLQVRVAAGSQIAGILYTGLYLAKDALRR
jgi:ADP-ribose pyrophosphatase